MQYKLEISNGWDETFVLESDSFEKLAAIQGFIVEQEADGWSEYLAEEEEEIFAEDEEGTCWVYDQELGEWCVVEEDEEDEE